MRDLARELEGLRDNLASVHRDVFILERVLRELGSVSDPTIASASDALIRAHLDAIAGRMSAALAKHATISRLMEECGRERREARFVRRTSVRAI